MSISWAVYFSAWGRELHYKQSERRRDCMKEKWAKIEMFINNRLGWMKEKYHINYEQLTHFSMKKRKISFILRKTQKKKGV